jgi:hypothetical protein
VREPNTVADTHSFTKRDAFVHTDSYAKRDTHGDAKCNTHSDAKCNADRNPIAEPVSYAECDADAFSYAQCNANRVCLGTRVLEESSRGVASD